MKKGLTELVFILDRSGSMSGLESDTIGGYNSLLDKQKKEDGQRCLSCDRVCEICAEVCPNRANVVIKTNVGPQIMHIDGMCNECGNCGTFCPWDGDPYKDKITLFWSKESFKDSTNRGIMFIDQNNVLVRDENSAEFVCGIDDDRISENLRSIIYAVKENYGYLLV